MTATCTAELRILGLQARVQAPLATLRELPFLVPAGPAWAAASPATHRAEICLVADVPAPGWRQLLVDGVPRWAGGDTTDVPAALEWVLTMTAIERLGDHYLLIHGGAAAWGDAGVVLCGASGSGKTTLLAALVAAGFRYLGDEMAALDLSTGRLHPVAKALCIKAGARQVLAGCYPWLAVDAGRRRFGQEEVWYLLPPAAAWAPAPRPIRYLVFPRYQPGACARLESLPRSVALLHLIEQCFNAAPAVHARLGAIVALLRGVECFALTSGDLTEGVARVRSLATS